MKERLPLDEKIRVQKKLGAEAGYDLSRHAEIVHERTMRLLKSHGVTTRYGVPKQKPALTGIAAESTAVYSAKRKIG